MMMSGKGKISEAELIACMSGSCEIDDLGRQDINAEADVEALRKAQNKRDRKAAKRLMK